MSRSAKTNKGITFRTPHKIDISNFRNDIEGSPHFLKQMTVSQYLQQYFKWKKI